MRIVCLIVLSVVVGWAASGVDWSREAIGQEAFNTADAEVPKGRPFIAADPMSNEKPASENISRPPQWPRRVYETRMEVDANGKRQPVTVSRLVNADGSDVPEPTPPALVGRFQASAYGSPNGHGCYVVDTMTGQTWHVASGEGRPATPEALNQPAAQPTATATTPLRGMSTFSSSPLMYSESSLGLEEGEGQSSEDDAIPAPTLELARPAPDANN